MADLTGPLAQLAADDLYRLSEAELLVRIRGLVAAENRLAAELARTVRRSPRPTGPPVTSAAERSGWPTRWCS